MQQSSGRRANGRGGGLPWFAKSKDPPQAVGHPGTGMRNVRNSPPPPASFPPLPAEPPPNGIETEDDQAEEESEYEEIDHLPQYSNGDGNMTRPAGVKWICSLCGSCTPAVRCQMCNNQLFCGACNEMYHRHPQRHCHVRKLLEVVHSRPPLPPKAFLQPQQRAHDAPPIPVHINSNGVITAAVTGATGLGVMSSRSPSPHHFSTQFLDGQGLPVPPPRRNRKFGSTSNLRSANNSPTLTRKFSFAFDPFGSLKRLVKGGANAGPETPPKQAPAPTPINKIAEVPILHNAWRQEVNAKRQQKQFQQILSNAAASASLQRLNQSDEFARPSIPTTVLEFGNRGNSRSFANLTDSHHTHVIPNRAGEYRNRQWDDEDNEIRRINRNDAFMDDYARQRMQFNNHSTSATNLHRMPTANPVPHFATLQRQTRNSIGGPAPAAVPMKFKPPIQPPPPIPPKEFFGVRQPNEGARQNSRCEQEQMFQSAYELNRAGAGAFVPWIRPVPSASRFQEFQEQQQEHGPPVHNSFSCGSDLERQASFDNSLPSDFDTHRSSEPVFHQRQELVYGNDSQQPGVERYYNNSGNQYVQETERPTSVSRAQSQVPPPVSQQKPRPNPKPQKPQQGEPESDMIKTPSTSKGMKHHQENMRNAEAETVTTMFKVTESPEGPWSCEHCTFVNPKSTKVCTICCKTPLEGYRTVCNVAGNTNLGSSPRYAVAAAKNIQNHSQSTQAKSNVDAGDKRSKKLARSPPPPPAQPSSSESESESESGDESESEESSSGNEDVIGQEPQPQVVPSKKAQLNNENKVYSRQNSREMKRGNGSGPVGSVKAQVANKGSRNTTRKIAAVEQKVTSNQKSPNTKASNLKSAKTANKTSKGTSPPPQEMSTQTYEAVPPKPRGQSLPKSALAYQSVAAGQSQSTASSSREESPPPAARIAMSEKAMRYARRAQQQSKLKRSASAHLTSAEIDEPWAFNEFHHHPNYHRRFHNQGHHQDYEGRHMYRSSSRHSLASDTRSLPVSGPPSRDTSPPSRRYYDDLRGSGVIPLKASWDRFPSPGDYFASIEDLVSRKRHESIKSQEFELSRLLKEAEELSYSPEDIQVALKMCGDRNPIKWMQENWSSMVETVQTLATKYGREKGQEQNDVGTISSEEAKEALRHHRGNVWAAVTECVETRRRKFSELQSRGTFLREDVLTALTAHHGNLNAAYVELSKAQLKPFLMRIWGPPSGHDNETSAPRTDSVLSLLSLDLLEQQKQTQNNSVQVVPPQGSSQQLQNLQLAMPVAVAQVQGQANANETAMQTPAQTQTYTPQAHQIQAVSEISAGPVLGSQAQITFNEKANANTGKPTQQRQSMETKTSTQTFASPVPSASENVIMTTAQACGTIDVDENQVKFDPEEETFVDASSDLNLAHSLDLTQKESLFSNTSSASTSTSTTSSSDLDLLLDESHISHFIQNFLVPEPPPYEFSDPILVKETRTLPEAPAFIAPPTSDFQQMPNVNKLNEITTLNAANELALAQKASPTLSVSAPTPSVHSPQSSMSIPSPCCSSSMSFGDDGGGGTRTSSELEKLFDETHQQMVSPQSQLENLAKAMNIITAKLGVLLVKQEAHDGSMTTAAAPTLTQDGSFQETIQKNEEAVQEFRASEVPRTMLGEPLQAITAGIPINLDATVLLSPPDEFNDALQQSESEHSTGGTVELVCGPMRIMSVPAKMIETRNYVQPLKGLNHYAVVPLTPTDVIPESNEVETNLAPTRNMDTSPSTYTNVLNAEIGKPNVQEVLIKDDPISESHFTASSQPNKDSGYLNIASTDENKAKNDKVGPVVLESHGTNLALPNGNVQEHDEPFQTNDAQIMQQPEPQLSVAVEESFAQLQVESNEQEESRSGQPQYYDELHDNYSDQDEEEFEYRDTDGSSAEGSNDEHEDVEEAELEFEQDGDGYDLGESEDGSFSLSDPESHEIRSDGEPQPQASDEDFDDDREGREDKENEDEEVLIGDEEDGIDVEFEEHPELEEGLGIADEENIYEEIQLCPDTEMGSNNADAVERNVAGSAILQGNSKTGSKLSRKKKLQTAFTAKAVGTQIQAQQVVKTIPRNAIAAIAQTLSSPTVATALTANEKSLTEIKINQYISAGKVRTVNQAQLALKLIDMNFTEDDSMAAATECSSLYTALCFLQQECLLCAGKFCAKQMISMLQCVHRCCRTCAAEYFMVQIRDHPIINLTCPFCKEPSNLNDDPEFTATTDYFSQLDIVLKDLLSERYHEMFQRKLRDWTLAKVPNFKWCSKCSSGFIMEPMQTRLVCPDCSAVTCAICLEEWDKVNHDHKDRRGGESLDMYDDEQDSLPPLKSIVNFLNENCIQCPSCKQRFTLARGGCMHLTCIQCHFEFCSGCCSQFRMGSKCSENAFCQKLGLHAHHPRNCLFYLRDKEPEMLRKLLDENKILYNKEDTQAKTTKTLSEIEKAADKGQAITITTRVTKCQVPILRETENGTEDDLCGQETCLGHETVCLVHYVEYLGLLIWQNGLDPISLLNNDDLETIIKRGHKRLPRKPHGATDAEYRPLLLKVIEDEIPL